mgnify:CR=1 FL=1|tara:strand:+ start:14059 stop:14616 length:558 start_codon:yes stop_codon:yes gene_type:complete
MIRKTEFSQETAQDSPWSFTLRVKMLCWEYCWLFFCSWTPKPLKNWRNFWLKLFGAEIHGSPFVHQRARIQIPWNIVLHNKSCVGDRANLYSLGKITLFEGSTIAQEAYICTGTHAFEKVSMNLITAPIIIEKNVFVGARAFIMPGVTLSENVVVAAMAVVTKDVAKNLVVGGNPAKIIKERDSI